MGASYQQAALPHFYTEMLMFFKSDIETIQHKAKLLFYLEIMTSEVSKI